MSNVEVEAFTTHKNYTACLKTLTSGVSLRFTPNLQKKSLPFLGLKDNLITLTKRSLEDECKIVDIDNDYSFASTAWLPITSYHLVYNIKLKIAYILTGEKNSYDFSHAKCGNFFTKLIEANELIFSNAILNTVFDKSIFDYHERPGTNLSTHTSRETMFRLAMKKVAVYKYEGWKRTRDLRTKKGKEERERYVANFRISVLEFPCYMRHRSHYRDFAFIDGIPTDATADYFNSYCDFIMNLFNALSNLCNDLAKKRE